MRIPGVHHQDPQNEDLHLPLAILGRATRVRTCIHFFRLGSDGWEIRICIYFYICIYKFEYTYIYIILFENYIIYIYWYYIISFYYICIFLYESLARMEVYLYQLVGWILFPIDTMNFLFFCLPSLQGVKELGVSKIWNHNGERFGATPRFVNTS